MLGSDVTTIPYSMYTYVFDLATKTISRMPYVFLAFADVPVSPPYFRGVPAKRLVGAQFVPFPVKQTEAGWSYGGLDDYPETRCACLAIIDDNYAARPYDVLCYNFPVDYLDDPAAERRYHVIPVIGTYLSKDIDMGFPDRYKLYKTLTLNVEACAEEYLEARRLEAFVYDGVGETPWTDTAEVEIEASVDGGAWLNMGTYSITLSSDDVDVEVARPPMTMEGVIPTSVLPKKGQVRLIPPTFDVVMGRSLRLRIRSDKCIIRKIDIEYAVRSMVPPTTANTMMEY